MTVVNSPLVGVQLHGESRRLRRLGALARLQRLHQALRRQQRVHLNRGCISTVQASWPASCLQACVCMCSMRRTHPEHLRTAGTHRDVVVLVLELVAPVLQLLHHALHSAQAVVAGQSASQQMSW